MKQCGVKICRVNIIGLKKVPDLRLHFIAAQVSNLFNFESLSINQWSERYRNGQRLIQLLLKFFSDSDPDIAERAGFFFAEMRLNVQNRTEMIEISLGYI